MYKALTNTYPSLRIQATYLCIDVNHCGKQKRKGLSRSSGTNSYHVFTLQRHGPSLALDWRGLVESLLEHFRQDILRHRCLIEGHAWLWKSIAENNDLFGSPPSLGFCLGSLRHVWMLDIKVFFKGNKILLGKVDLI